VSERRIWPTVGPVPILQVILESVTLRTDCGHWQ
jgi:hypothetical protein